MNIIRIILITVLTASMSIASELHGLANAISGVTQEWHLERPDGNLLRVTVFSTVDPSEWGTSAYFIAFDYLTGDTFYINADYYYWSEPSTDESVIIPSMDEAKRICADWLASHISAYSGATELTWTEIWIADVPDWNSWFWLESIGTTLSWWADWDQNGVRFSNSEPADFGKWTWDGSINPSWAEPLAALEHGKRLAKGHGK